MIVSAAIFILTPALVIYLCSKVKIAGKIGPIFILYAIGAILGNTSLLPDGVHSVQETLSNICVPLSIPLLLMGNRIDWRNSGKPVLSIVSGFVAVIAAVIAAYLILGESISTPQDQELGRKIGAMMAGTYTGGTVNMASIQKMLDIPEETFVIANTLDMAVSFVYLTFLLSIGIRLFRKILPHQTNAEEASPDDNKSEDGKRNNNMVKDGIVSAITSGAIVGISYLIATIADRKTDSDIFMMVLILSITTAGIIASYIKPLSRLKTSTPIGMYLIYIFSMVVASMADFREISLMGSMKIMGFLAIVVFGSLIFHTLLARLLKIDADTMVITSTALVNSPPFVPVISEAMGNRSVMVTGLTAGIIGYALGNYLGVSIYSILSLL